ncbi:hypothetical protein J6590_087289 [Homalodisca vitripennis]|nr:hypothetical protein J6590_097054 [Homalodisca vitripennis]KAG8275416.1 hypothetical protein J6590_086380 [Homalodisca vitripennis]KAG8275419.1 hypothetical protein J6590_086383 [Homalodisca vitripennis]KAG8290234.1 hypothetical protein J6590_087289 [Homalodisca vitripennis]
MERCTRSTVWARPLLTEECEYCTRDPPRWMLSHIQRPSLRGIYTNVGHLVTGKIGDEVSVGRNSSERQRRPNF